MIRTASSTQIQGTPKSKTKKTIVFDNTANSSDASKQNIKSTLKLSLSGQDGVSTSIREKGEGMT